MHIAKRYLDVIDIIYSYYHSTKLYMYIIYIYIYIYICILQNATWMSSTKSLRISALDSQCGLSKTFQVKKFKFID